MHGNQDMQLTWENVEVIDSVEDVWMRKMKEAYRLAPLSLYTLDGAP